MTEASTVTQKVKNAEKAEKKLTTLKANKESKEQYLGVPSKATITDVQTENLDENIVIRFIVNLPTEKTGYIDFTEYMVNDDKLDIFLDNIGCTINDITDGLYATIPVTYTDWHGWKTFYSNNESNLKPYTGESNWRVIESDIGFNRPNTKLSIIYNVIPMIISVSVIVYSMEFTTVMFIFSAFIGFIIWAFIWYMDAAYSGMSSPKNSKIKIK